MLINGWIEGYRRYRTPFLDQPVAVATAPAPSAVLNVGVAHAVLARCQSHLQKARSGVEGRSERTSGDQT